MRRLLFIITLTLFVSSCRKEGGTSVAVWEREVDMNLVTTLNTRAGDNLDESAIKQIDILVFDSRDLSHDDATLLYYRYAWHKVGNTYQTTLKLGEHLDIYTAINVRDLVNSGQITVGMKWSQVREKLIMTNPQLIDVQANGLPMWGSVYDYTVSDRPINHLGSLKLLRAVSSAEVKITALNFSLTKGYIVFGADRGYLPFSPSNIDLNYIAKTPEVPTNMFATTQWSHTVASGESEISNKFYLFDNDAPLSGRSSTKVIVQGRWSGSKIDQDTFYPLAFRNPATNGKMAVTRNTKYIIIVTSVNGDGYPDLESAKSGEDVNMDYEVIPWNDQTHGDIMVDGTKFLSLPSKHTTLYRQMGATSQIVFSTNYKLNEIAMTFDRAAEPVYGLVDDHNRFKAETLAVPNTQWSYTCFMFTAKQPYGTTDNPATLYVTAGRISFEIVVEQLNTHPNDWNQGGDEKHELNRR